MTVEIKSDPWVTLDGLLGVEVVDHVDDGLGPVAVYGRCSTEDNQDPETSRGWQFGNARKFVEPLGGTIGAEYFDIGLSRSVPWERRDQSAELLAALKDPNRGWDAVVVGEGTRCWFGNQFSLIAPRFEAYGVDLWVPELGGKYDPRNPSHKMLMSVLGGMSESERQHVQARVRAAMDAQVLNEGRHQGGRAPYGYVVVDGGPHPNPRKSAEGYRLRVLAIDDEAAEVVRRIFAEYLDGKGDRAIANSLNRDGIPCPSARRPEQNRHRLADGWQGSTVRSILENPRYTGYAFFGRWTKQETLLDPGGPVAAAGASGDRVGRPVHRSDVAAALARCRWAACSEDVGAWAEGSDEAGVSAAGAGAVRVLLAEDGGHAPQGPDLLPVRGTHDGAGGARAGRTPEERVPPGARRPGTGQRVVERAIRPRERRPDR
jgi:DNA invertase Pin-like site-specific DNA recombinase